MKGTSRSRRRRSSNYEFSGVTIKLKLGVGNGEAQVDDAQAFDDGTGGTSIEYFNTYANCQVEMDLDSFDNCNAFLNQSKGFVKVDGTCDGECSRIQTVYSKNDLVP